MINIEALQKVKQHILDDPRRINMGIFGKKFSQYEIDRMKNLPDCGTVACICGWANALYPSENKTIEFVNTTRASNILGLDNAFRLFFTNEWPVYFSSKLSRAKFGQEYAEVVAELIDFICENPETLNYGVSQWLGLHPNFKEKS